MKVLVVDDSAVIRCVIARAMESVGIRRVHQANDGIEALELLQTEEVELVISDYFMPKLDGLELTKAIRAQYADMPILMVSIVDSREKIIEVVQAGVNDYLIKPFTRDELLQKVERFLPVEY